MPKYYSDLSILKWAFLLMDQFAWSYTLRTRLLYIYFSIVVPIQFINFTTCCKRPKRGTIAFNE